MSVVKKSVIAKFQILIRSGFYRPCIFPSSISWTIQACMSVPELPYRTVQNSQNPSSESNTRPNAHHAPPHRTSDRTDEARSRIRQDEEAVQSWIDPTQPRQAPPVNETPSQSQYSRS